MNKNNEKKLNANELGCFVKVEKIIKVGLQDKKETENVIKFNEQNNNEYIIVCDGNLINSKYLLIYLKAGYEVRPYSVETLGDEYLSLKHK